MASHLRVTERAAYAILYGEKIGTGSFAEEKAEANEAVAKTSIT